MQGSYFHHLFLLCIWLSVQVPQLGCDAVSISGQEDRAAANQCWQKCSLAANVSRSTAKAFESPETCYKECLKKSRNHQFAGNDQGKALSRRIKRDANMSTDLKPNCSGKVVCMEYVRNKSSIKRKDIQIGLEPIASSQNFYRVSICWETSSGIARNWTDGYMVTYRSGSKMTCCPVPDMRTSYFSFIVTNDSASGFLKVMVISLSEDRDDSNQESNNFQQITFEEATKPPEPFTADNFCGRIKGTVAPTSKSRTTDAPKALIAIGATVAFVIMVVAAVIWRRFVERGNEEMDVALLDLGFKFDAFIIYSTTDEQWVKKKLLSTLEKKHNMKCCIHYRDFLPGVPFVENMAQSVYNSRKTIAVVSKSFLSSNYCNHELNIALHRLVERGDNSVIVIKLDDVEDSKLPIELQFRSYIDFTKASDKKTWEYKLVHSFIGERC
ncbi:uncharacterized protein LOC114976864 isoform X2 [Acropora millepora]|uniref:uncharacterized protein LOC114976864 isoform X2 n=1 Tax=Acropora millepora TaxID=45264 RepID=UPI001CF3078A|nr:uncharacterized protein LOC114976864 isoform X2 [Acropora millepora]